MKLKIKYSNTQKFIINIDDATIGSVKEAIRKFVNDTYNCSVREPFYLSINGKTALEGSDEDPVQSVGIVPGDLISVIYEMPQQQPQGQPYESSSTHNTRAAQQKSECSKPWGNMDKQSLGTNGTSNPAQKEENGWLSSVPKSTDHLQTSYQAESKQGQIPPRVFELFDQARPPGPSEAMNLLVHLAMLEGGFQTVDAPEGLPSNWKELAVTIKYQHMRYASFTCIVVMVTMGNVKKVLASFPKQELELSVSLKIEQYIISGQSPVQYQHLKCLASLDLMLKNKLLYPLHVAAHQTLGVPAPWQLHGLPHEILLQIAFNLDVCSTACLAATCSSLRQVMDSGTLWKKLCLRDFPKGKEPVNGDWKSLYKAQYLQKKKSSKEFHIFNEDFFPYEPLSGIPTMPGAPPYPGLPHPWGDPVPVPNPLPNPFHDPDSPYFSGDVPLGPGMPNPLGPIGPLGPRQPRNPLQPSYPLIPKYPGRGPRFDYF